LSRRILKHEGKMIGVVSEQLFRPADNLNAFELRLAFTEAMVHMIASRHRQQLSDEDLLERSLKLLAPGRGFDADRALPAGELSARYGLPHELIVKRLGLKPDTVYDSSPWGDDQEAKRKEAREEQARQLAAKELSHDDEEETEPESPPQKRNETEGPSEHPTEEETTVQCPDFVKTVVENELFHWCNWLGHREILLSRAHINKYCLGDFKTCPKRKF